MICINHNILLLDDDYNYKKHSPPVVKSHQVT